MDLGEAVLAPGFVDAHAHLEWSLMDGVLPSQPFGAWLGRLLAAARADAAGGPSRRRPPRGRCARCGPAPPRWPTPVPPARPWSRWPRPACAGRFTWRPSAVRRARRPARSRPASPSASPPWPPRPMAAPSSACRPTPRTPSARGSGPRSRSSRISPAAPGPPTWPSPTTRPGSSPAATARWRRSSPPSERFPAGGRGRRVRARWSASPRPAPCAEGSWPRTACSSATAIRPCWPRPAWAWPTARARTSTCTAAGRPCPRCARPACPWASAPTAPRAAATTTCAPRRGPARGCTATPPARPRTLMALATIGGARVLGLDAEVGSLAPGKRADLVALRTAPGSPRDPFAAALAPGTQVTTVVIDGDVALAEGRPAGIDAAEVETAAAEPDDGSGSVRRRAPRPETHPPHRPGRGDLHLARVRRRDHRRAGTGLLRRRGARAPRTSS